jgi:hypothetical protein
MALSSGRSIAGVEGCCEEPRPRNHDRPIKGGVPQCRATLEIRRVGSTSTEVRMADFELHALVTPARAGYRGGHRRSELSQELAREDANTAAS